MAPQPTPVPPPRTVPPPRMVPSSRIVPPPRVVVVGGGISGLAAAAILRARGVEVTVLEGSPSIGGKLALGEVAGIPVDVGADSMLNRRPEGIELARRSGLGARLVHPATISANLWTRGAMRPMPRTLMGVPADARALAESGIISRAGLARAALDSVLPATRLEGQDVSVGWLVEERFGREVVDRLVEPLLGGVYAGHARELSASAAVPQLMALLDRDKSMLKAAAAATSATSDAPVFVGLVGGLGQLPQAVASSAAAEMRTSATVRNLTREADEGWSLVVGSTHDPETVQADAVVLATPAAATSRLLSYVVPDAALELARIAYASMAVITMAFRARDFPETSGSGFLVPPVDGRDIKAVTYSFAKWDWVRRAGRGADGGEDVLVIRCSIGRHREEHVLQVADEDLVQTALKDLVAAIGLSVRPVDWHVRRWGGALPQYAVGHVERVRHIRSSVAKQPGLAVCGAAYDGLGIPACVASAELAATQVLSGLAGRREWTHD